MTVGNTEKVRETMGTQKDKDYRAPNKLVIGKLKKIRNSSSLS